MIEPSSRVRARSAPCRPADTTRAPVRTSTPDEAAALALEALHRHPVVPVVGGLVADAGGHRTPIGRDLSGAGHPRDPSSLGQQVSGPQHHLGGYAAPVGALAPDQAGLHAHHVHPRLGESTRYLLAPGSHPEDDHVGSLVHRSSSPGQVSTTGTPVTAAPSCVDEEETATAPLRFPLPPGTAAARARAGAGRWGRRLRRSRRPFRRRRSAEDAGDVSRPRGGRATRRQALHPGGRPRRDRRGHRQAVRLTGTRQQDRPSGAGTGRNRRRAWRPSSCRRRATTSKLPPSW